MIKYLFNLSNWYATFKIIRLKLNTVLEIIFMCNLGLYKIRKYNIQAFKIESWGDCPNLVANITQCHLNSQHFSFSAFSRLKK